MKKFIFLFFLFYSNLIFSQVNPVEKILQNMYDGHANLRSAKFTMHTEERMRNGKFVISEMMIKLKENPKQVYLYALKPDLGNEIIWRKGWNDEKMMISPGSFPFITFSMKTENSLARKDAHHPITNVGFGYVTGLVKYYSKKFGSRLFEYVSISDTVNWDNHSCIVLKFDFKDYAIVKYTVGSNENITRIAEKLYLNDYAILILNKDVDDFDDVKPGQIINVPNSYARKIEFYLDRLTGLPLRQFIYDKNGLYEKYEVKSFMLNPLLKDEEFSPDYPSYKF